MLGTSLSGAQAAFVLTTGQALPSPAAAGTTAGDTPADPAAAASSAGPAAAAGHSAAANGTAAEKDDVTAQHERLRQRLAAAAAAAQARQRVSAAVAAAAQAGNPALEAAAAADAAGVMQAPNVAKLRLWNPMTGHVVPVRDASCELREVRQDVCQNRCKDMCTNQLNHVHKCSCACTAWPHALFRLELARVSKTLQRQPFTCKQGSLTRNIGNKGDRKVWCPLLPLLLHAAGWHCVQQ